MRRDPLRALGELRNRQVDESVAKLAARAREVDQARLRRQAEEHAWQREQAQNQDVQKTEQRHLDSGCARAADLARAADYGAGAELRARNIERRLGAAREREELAERERSKAHKELEEAEAARLALERFGARKAAVERKRSERRTDEDQMDRYNATERKVPN